MKYLALPALTALLFTGIAIAAEPSAGAQSSPPPSSDPTASFQQLDKNHDGVISKGEAARDARLKRDFEKCDANRDGKIDINEYQTCVLNQTCAPAAPMGRRY